MQFPLELLRRCWFLSGPTACGKSDVGLNLAMKLDAEIVALDSMSLYRGLDVGTAKPSSEARRTRPHHLIDVIGPHEEYSLADYVQAAEAASREIVSRGRTPLFVGGTGLYLRGILRGVFNGPPADWKLRRRLESEAQREGPEILHRRLQEVDPAAAELLHPHDVRRETRGLEVYYSTGLPLSQQQQQKPLTAEQRPRHVYWLSPPREWLYGRINRRVEAMFAAGLVGEVQRLLSGAERLGDEQTTFESFKGGDGDPPQSPPSQGREDVVGWSLSRTARQALGYKEVIDYLKGRGSLEMTVELIQKRTRQFAKRQHTWFRNLEECRPVEITGRETPQDISERLLEADGIN